MKKIVFSIIIVLLFFLILDVAVRGYLCLKYRNFQYLKPNVTIESEHESINELKIKGDLVNKEGYYKFRGGKFAGESFGLFKDTKFSFTINSLGFRGEEFVPKKEDNITRICILGGSAVWGHGLEDTQTFPFYLEELLGSKFEVINCGFPRYKMANVYNLLKNELMRYSPDIIVVYSAFNDAFEPRLTRGMSILTRLHEILYYRWMLYTVLLEKYSITKYGSPLPFFMLVRDIPDDYYKNLKPLIETAKNKGIEVILVKQPLNLLPDSIRRKDSRKQLEKVYAKTTDEFKRRIILHHYYACQAEELAEENNLLFVDSIPVLEGREELFFDQIHLNPEGARLLAQLVAKDILKTNKRK
jgi:lysophospholipase L1-like esterase